MRNLSVPYFMALLCLAFWSPVSAIAQGRAPAPKVVSLDNCADQYVLGLVPRDDILALSPRARLSDSAFRDRAEGVRRIQTRLESILALQPDIVVRTWGGDFKLIQALQAHHVQIVNIGDVKNYDEARTELLHVGGLLKQPAAAEIEAHRLTVALSETRDVGKGRRVLYYTPGGYTAGPDTMVGTMLTRLGFRLETQNKGEYFLSPEVLLSLKPDVFALAFYDDAYAMRRTPGRNPLVRHVIAQTPHFALPDDTIACAGWFTAYRLQTLSQYFALEVGS